MQGPQVIQTFISNDTLVKCNGPISTKNEVARLLRSAGFDLSQPVTHRIDPVRTGIHYEQATNQPEETQT